MGGLNPVRVAFMPGALGSFVKALYLFDFDFFEQECAELFVLRRQKSISEA